jgi:RimJ/RimL family protein N-acetyltransferase
MTDEPTTYFETRRLLARSFVTADVEAFVAYRADPDVARYQSWSDFTLERGHDFVASLRGATPGVPGEWFQFALERRSGGGLVGDLALKVDADEPRQAEVGFTLAPAHQGQGYATEALEGLLEHAFDAFGLHRVVAVTDALNAPAAALLERMGMRREGHFIENIFFKGAWGSEFLFAVLDREWRSRTARRPDSQGS